MREGGGGGGGMFEASQKRPHMKTKGSPHGEKGLTRRRKILHGIIFFDFTGERGWGGASGYSAPPAGAHALH